MSENIGLSDWDKALEALANHPHNWRFTQLCADDNPDATQRDAMRRRVVAMATGEPIPVHTAWETEQAQAPCGCNGLPAGVYEREHRTHSHNG